MSTPADSTPTAEPGSLLDRIDRGLGWLVLYPLGTWGYFGTLDWSGETVARELLLHGGQGVLCGWLYWRHGWLAGVTGHICAQLALQPLLTAWS